MRIALIAIITLVVTPVFAQQQTTPEQYQAVIQSLRQQRDAANDQAAQLGAQLSLVNKEVAEMKAKSEADKKPSGADTGK